jgi:fatty acid desaturase
MTKNPLLVSPVFAWPTIVVLAVAWAAWAAGLYAIATGALPAALAVALSTLGAYVAFTPLHEAIHGTVARRRIANELVGRLSAVLLLGPFGAVRQVHLQHHRHTNDPVRDPDHWSGLGPAWLLPLRG